MKRIEMKSVYVICLLAILFAGNSQAAVEGYFVKDLSYVECVADGNDTHTAATLINRSAIIYDAVCETDAHDWYLLPLQGDVRWGGDITCLADGPGLRVGLYIDQGAGPQLIVEDSPILTTVQGTEQYMLEWDLLDLAAGAGFTSAQAGNYYVRVTYYTYHPGNHPYSIWMWVAPEEYDASPYDSSITARPLPPGIMHFGHLNYSDPVDWFTFTIETGQSGTGVIFGESFMPYGVFLIKQTIEVADDVKIEPVQYSWEPIYSLRLYASDLTLIASREIPKRKHNSMCLQAIGGPLDPGTYYIELVNDSPGLESDFETYYKIFNHCLAPNIDEWHFDYNGGMESSEPFLDGIPISDSVWAPRDSGDFYSFTSPGYFLGDVKVDPAVDFMYLHTTFLNTGANSVGGRWIPGLGISCRNTPRPAGDYYFRISDNYRMFYPTEYTVTFYQHGGPLTSPMGHDTWQTAMVMEPESKEGIYTPATEVSIDFNPGVQDIYYCTLEVPPDGLLVGYYKIFGSRTDYRVRLGKLGPGGTPVWSPAMLPNTYGVVDIDLAYDFLSEAGTYFLEVQMLPSSPGQLRIYIMNQSTVASCEPDNNNTYDEAWNLLHFQTGSTYRVNGRVCPVEDDVDWYYFESGIFDDTKGIRKYLSLKGAAVGMRYELYDGNLDFLRDGEVTEMGGSSIIDLDAGVVLQQWEYYIKVIAAPAEERVQLYELNMYNDNLWVLPMLEFQMFSIREELFNPGWRPGVFDN